MPSDSDIPTADGNESDCTQRNMLRLCYSGRMAKHTHNGKPVLTIDELGERHGLDPSSVRAFIAREKADGREIPIADHCGRMALYDPRVFQRALDARPGKGGRR